MNAGFQGFDLLDFPDPPKATTRESGCEGCKRDKGCRTKFGIYGEGRKGILIIAENPSRSDDVDGIPLSGDSGAILHREARKHGIDIYRDCWILYAVRCHDPADFQRSSGNLRGPLGPHVLNCRPFLQRDIKNLGPRVILPLGIHATQGVLESRMRGRMTSVKPTDFFGNRIPDQEYKAWVCPTYGLLQMLEYQSKDDYRDLFAEHVGFAFSAPEFPEQPKDNIDLIYSPAKAIQAIQEARAWGRGTGGEVGFDYETTGIKPHREGHKILCASIGWDDKAACFPMFPDPDFLASWKTLLTDSKVPKAAHQSQFEMSWTFWMLGYWPVGWGADTCIDAHVLHNQKPTSLKYEVYTRLGIIGYDDKADKFIRATAKEEDLHGCNAFNRMEECPVPDMLEYCAKDSLYMMRVRKQQLADLRAWRPQVRGSRFFLEAAQTQARSSMHGMHLDTGLAETSYRDLEKQVAASMELAYQCPEVRAMGEGFSLTSNRDLARLVYDHLKTPSDSRSVDKEHLEAVDAPFVEHLLEARKLDKMKSTYFSQYRKEAVGGMIRGTLGLTKASSFRGNHSAPNLGNVPKRDKRAQKIVRTAFVAPAGYRIIESDYKAIEVAVGACYHKDRNMIRYVTDPNTNMHSDMGCRVFFREREWFDAGSPLSKVERQAAKNGFVFPSFYGSNFENTHLGIWKQITEETKEHLRGNGIRNRADFKQHIEDMDRVLWKEMFPDYYQWKRDIYRSYQHLGCVELYTGFRCRGPLSYTEATNLQIQGTAFHCLLWTKTKVSPLIEGLSGRSRVVLDIHDALVSYIHQDEVEEARTIIREWGETRIREQFPWLIVPLTIEFEGSEVGGSWAKMSGMH